MERGVGVTAAARLQRLARALAARLFIKARRGGGRARVRYSLFGCLCFWKEARAFQSGESGASVWGRERDARLRIIGWSALRGCHYDVPSFVPSRLRRLAFSRFEESGLERKPRECLVSFDAVLRRSGFLRF